MIRVAAVATAVTCHSNGTAGIVTSKSKSPDHASRISVSTASAAIAPKNRVHACLGGTVAKNVQSPPGVRCHTDV